MSQRHKAMPRQDMPGFLHSLEIYEGEPQTRLALNLVVHTFLRTGGLARRKAERD